MVDSALEKREGLWEEWEFCREGGGGGRSEGASRGEGIRDELEFEEVMD